MLIGVISILLYNILITLLKGLHKKHEEDKEQLKMDERYLKIISNQLLYICKRQDEIINCLSIEKTKNKYKMLLHKPNRSYSNIYDA